MYLLRLASTYVTKSTQEIRDKLCGTQLLVDIVRISVPGPAHWFKTHCSVQVTMCRFSAYGCTAVITWSREDRGSGKYNATRLRDAVCRGHKQFACFPLIQQSKLSFAASSPSVRSTTFARFSDASISYPSRPRSNHPAILRYNSPTPTPTSTHTHTQTDVIILYWHTAFNCTVENVAGSHVQVIKRIQT